MRVLVTIAGAALLCGCSTYAGPSSTITESGKRAPAPGWSGPRQAKVEKSTPVERWTREQRRCEVGDRDDQRKCVMPYPGD